MSPCWCVLEVEPAHPELGGSEAQLSATDQINEVYLFDSEREAHAFVAWRDEVQPHRVFHVRKTTDPRDALRGRKETA